MEEPREIRTVTVAGHTFPAYHAICPKCNVLDLDTRFEYLGNQWSAKCSKGHYWGFRIGLIENSNG